MPAEPPPQAAGATNGGPGAAAPAAARLRIALLALAAAAVFVAVVLIGSELAAGRAAQHRAALEELIRHETGLEMSFSELSLGWGWHGPEAVFTTVVLGEPGGAALLRAPRLSIALDLWRMARSGHLEAGRITLEGADIDLATRAGAAAPPPRLPRPDRWSTGARILSRFRSGVLEIRGGTLRGPAPFAPGMLTVRHALLRRSGDDWSAEAHVLLPQRLGESARLALQMSGDPALPQSLSGTLRIEGHRLELGGWRLLGADRAQRYLPRSGSGNLAMQLSFAAGRLLGADGTLSAAGLEWPATAAGAAPPALPRVRGAWQLARRGDDWHFVLSRLEIPAADDSSADSAPATATLFVDAAANGGSARGRALHLPLSALALIAAECLPLPRLDQLSFGGEARELTFEWSGERPAGSRLRTRAELAGLTFSSSERAVMLGGLRGSLTGTESHMVAQLEGEAAQLSIVGGPQTQPIDDLSLAVRLAFDVSGNGGWQLTGDDLQLRRASTTLVASGSIGAAAAGAAPRVSAHLAVKDADIALLARLLGPQALRALGPAAMHLTAGRIESAQVTWRAAPLMAALWDAPPDAFSGAVTLRDAHLSRDELWPEADSLDARILWRGARLRAAIEHARSGSFRLSGGSADWDARSARPLHFAAHLSGSAAQALDWLRAHPQLAAWTSAAGALELRGDTFIDVDVALPGEAPAAAGSPFEAAPRVRVAARLEGAQLQVLPGLPPIEALQGALAFSGEHLQRSTFSGQWLGGPVTLSVGEPHEPPLGALTISGRGLIAARDAVQAAGGDADQAQLAGNAEWSALLSFFPATELSAAHWQLHGDSALIGVTSRLPEPFAKSAATALPLQLDVQGAAETSLLRVNLGERLHALAALVRSGDRWRIERGAVRLAASTPALPAQPVMLLDGRLSHLDLAACLGLWRALASDAALPELRARLSAGVLLAGGRNYRDVALAARVARGGGTIQLDSAELLASARWPALIEREHPAVVHLASFNITEPGDAGLSVALAAALAPATELSIDELQLAGHSLGRLAGTLAARPGGLEVSELRLAGIAGDAQLNAHCADSACQARFSLTSADAAATLTAFGFRPEVSAGAARLEGELRWSPLAPLPLATLAGHLHMQLSDGLVHPGAGEGVRFALLSVPALLAGNTAGGANDSPRPLAFARLTADFELQNGEASTAGLHFDGDAEILVRGRVGLAAGDYDEQAWVLHGEERLPAPLRRLEPTPRVAALWLSLRDWFAGAERSRAALRLQGPWDEPVVTSAE